MKEIILKMDCLAELPGQNRLYEFRLGKKDEIKEKTDCKAVEREGEGLMLGTKPNSFRKCERGCIAKILNSHPAAPGSNPGSAEIFSA